jgi:hypothetical protein
MQDLIIKTGKENMDVKMIHRFLNEDSYWAKGIPYALVDDSLNHSFCTGFLYRLNKLRWQGDYGLQYFWMVRRFFCIARIPGKRHCYNVIVAYTGTAME